MPQLTHLFIYPIKSCGGVALERAQLSQGGLEHDRIWMLVDADNRFMNQQRFPHMARVQLSPTPGGFRAEAPGVPALFLAASPPPEPQTIHTFKVYKSHVQGHEVSAHASGWFAQVLKTPCRLVRTLARSTREVAPENLTHLEPTRAWLTRVDFADDLPLLVASQSSLARLNEHLDERVEMSRFRANIILGDEAAPFEENAWASLRSESGLTLHSAKPCVRCSLIMVHPERGEAQGPEPLQTLSTLHNLGSGPVFGQLMISDRAGELRVGETLSPLP